MIIVVVVVPVGLCRLFPFVGTGCRPWAVVGPWWSCVNGHGRWRLFSRLLVIVGGAVVVMCEWSWAVVAVFVWWRSLVVVLGGCSCFCVVVFDRGPLGWAEVGHCWASRCGYGRGSNSVISPVEFRDSSRIPGRIPGGE